MADLANVHPELRARLKAMQADPGWKKYGLSLTSGARTYEMQKALYQKYKAGRGNLAANPDRVNSAGRKGSNHMVQNPLPGDKRGWGFALDISHRPKTAANLRGKYSLFAKYGFTRTVPSEDWHVELTDPKTGSAYRYGGPVPGWNGKRVRAQEVYKEGDKGEFVENLEGALIAMGFLSGKADEFFDRSTALALAAWQRTVGLKDDGIWGPVCEEAGAKMLEAAGFGEDDNDAGEDNVAMTKAEADKFIDNVYRKVAGTAPDPAGKKFWDSHLAATGFSGALDLVAELFDKRMDGIDAEIKKLKAKK